MSIIISGLDGIAKRNKRNRALNNRILVRHMRTGDKTLAAYRNIYANGSAHRGGMRAASALHRFFCA